MPQGILYDATFFSTNTVDKLTHLVKELTSSEGAKAHKALAYYDGRQEQEVIKFFNQHRKDWQNDSLIPRTRNIVKMIVEKSGQIVHDTPPIYEVHTGTEADLSLDEAHTEHLIDLFNKADSIETWLNLDEMVRLLKTTLVLVAWDDETQQLVYDLLHRGNALIKWNTVTKIPEMLLYNLFTHHDYESYRLIVSDQVIDFNFQSGVGKVTITFIEDNPLGIVPVAQFYDTAAPRVGFWNVVPTDLVSVNEMYNISMSDSEYAMGWMKRPTLFTNANLDQTAMQANSSFNNSPLIDITLGKTAKFPRVNAENPERLKFGPSTAVQLDSTGVDSPFVEFKAPDVSLLPLEQVVADWVEAVASDYSVRAKVGGSGSASSGFQLVVEELPNLELRKQRQKMFAVGLSRLFEVVKVIANTFSTTTFPDEAKLFVTFGQPKLPVETEKEEAVWTTRIAEKRATVLDYFIEAKGMSKEEAMAKVAEIAEFNATTTNATAAPVVPVPPTVEDEDQRDESETEDNE